MPLELERTPQFVSILNSEGLELSVEASKNCISPNPPKPPPPCFGKPPKPCVGDPPPSCYGAPPCVGVRPCFNICYGG